MLLRYLLALLLVLPLVPLALHAQDDDWEEEEMERRVDHGERTRPMLDPDFELEHGDGKRDLRPLMAVPAISSEFGLFPNSNLIQEGTQANPQNESSIAINPLNPNIIIASAVDARNGAFLYRSSDGGKTWTNVNLGVVNTNWVSGNDPSVGWDYQGNAYLMYGAFARKATGEFTGESGVYIARSTDGGLTWTAHIKVIEHKGTTTPDTAFEDKYYIQVDNSASSPFRGRMYTPWKRVIDRDSSTQIVSTFSTDSGNTWSTPVRVSPRKSGTSTDTTFGQSFPIMTTGPDGAVYLFWNDGPIRSIGFAKSNDGGVNWSAPSYPVQGYPTLGTPKKVGTDVYHVLKGTFRAETYPSTACDVSNSPRSGWLYLVWASGTNPDIRFIRSTDGGASWSTPVLIQSDTTGDAWWPWISVDPTNGDIAVMYADSRNDPNNILIDQYISYSSDGGTTWIDRRATDAQSDYRKNPYVGGVFAGDYSGNSFYNGRIYPSFLDTRSANFENDVFTAVVSTMQPLPVESLRVRSRTGDITTAELSWVNPPLRTVFDRPITDYTLVVERDGSLLTSLPAGTTSFTDAGRVPATEYRYTVRVALVGDTSVARNVRYRGDLARLPLAPTADEIQRFASSASFTSRIPSLRADSVTPLAGVALLRVYRDGALLREDPLTDADTNTLKTVNDSPAARGYYHYHLTVVDTAGLESASSDTITLYAGSFDPYTEPFDGDLPHFLYGGTWGRTATRSLSGQFSVTDSPDGDYRGRTDNTLQIWPVTLPASGVDLRFAQIAIVDPGDTAYVEVSYDSAATWSVLRSYSMNSDDRWKDKTADAGDWRSEFVPIPAQSGASTAIVRFRLHTGTLTNLDGWYLDDISFGQPSGVDRRNDRGRFGLSITPSPAREAVVLHLQLPVPSDVRAVLYDLRGRAVLEREWEAGEGENAFTLPLDEEEIPAGVYTVRVQVGGSVATERVTVVR